MKKLSKPIAVTTKATKPYHLLVYIEGCTQKIKKFNSERAIGLFIDAFVKQYPDYADDYSDNWIDFSISNITGNVHFFTDGLEVD